MSSDKKTGGFKAWLVRLLTRFLFLLIVFVAGALTMHFGMHADDHDNMVQLQTTVDNQDKQIHQLQADLAQAQSSSSLEQGTKKALEDQISNLQQELTDVRDQLSFYEQLVPPGPAGSVTVRAFSAQQKGDVLEYKALITRNVKPDTPAFTGHIQFIVSGILAGQEHQQTIKPEDKSDDTDNDSLSVEFERFQRSTGVLKLTPEFKVQSVQFEIYEGDKLRAKSQATLGVQQ